jgi:hypothetical protein
MSRPAATAGLGSPVRPALKLFRQSMLARGLGARSTLHASMKVRRSRSGCLESRRVVVRAFTGNAAPVHPRSRDHHIQLGEEPHTIDRPRMPKVSL